MGSFKDVQIDSSEQQEKQTGVAAGTPPQLDNQNHIVSISLNMIDTSFTNTRRKVSQSDVDALKASISQIGLISAITVKLLDDGMYQLVSGFNRVEALRQLSFSNVNAIVMQSDGEAHVLEANMAENMVRKGLSLGEQSSAIKRLFTTLEGSEENKIDQISVRLNLSKKAVKDRLVLTSLLEEGLGAFDDGKISLKSAIILAGLTDAEQQNLIPKLVEGTLTHDGLLEEVGKATLPLSMAKFDLSQCQQCPSNTQLQGSLFSDSDNQSDEAKCQNPSCFKQKSKSWFDTRVEELETTYGTIIPVSQIDRAEINPINERSLGSAQISQCSGCANNINLIQNKIGNTFGDVVNNVCNNKQCFIQCAATYSETKNLAQSETHTNNGTVADYVLKGKLETRNTDKTQTAKKPKKPVATASLSKAARENARTALAEVQFKNGLNDQQDIAMLTLLSVLRLTGNTNKDIAVMVKAKDMSIDELQTHINKLLLAYLKDAMKETGDGNYDRPIGNVLIGMLKAKSQIDDAIIASWTPKQLRYATKSGIKAILEEAKFDIFYDENQKVGAFNSLMNGKLDVIHTAIAKSGFDFTSFAPQSYQQYARKVATSIQ